MAQVYPGALAQRGHRYRSDVDGLRALAILPVILFHAELGCPGGFVGVDIFFVISGFLITSLILSEIREGRFSLIAFWERRIRRILPALFPVVFAALVAGWFLYLPNDFKLLGRSVVAQALLLSNFFFWRHTGYFDPGSDTMPLLHTWSLAVEEQFYVLFPPLLLVLARQQRFPLAGTILCLGIGSFELSVLGSGLYPSANFFLLPTRAWELMLGAWLAVSPGKTMTRPWLNETAGVAGLGLILYSILCYNRQTVFPGLAALAPCLGTGLVIFSGGGKPTLIRRLLSLPPLVFIGLISYSLYLWHWPLLVLTKYINLESQTVPLRVALLILSVVLSILSWKLVETPFRKRLVCPRRSQIFALASGSMVLLVALGWGVYSKQGMAFRLPAQALRYQHPAFDTNFQHNLYPAQAAAGQFAELGGQSTNQPLALLLWGDSHAMAVAPALDELCRRFALRGLQATHLATAPVLGYVHHSRMGLNEHSLAFSQSVVDFIARNRIPTVIIAANWSSYGPPAVLGDRLAATVGTLRSSGAQVCILKDVPHAGFDVPRFATLSVLRHGDPAKLGISREKYAADNREYEPIFNRLSQMGATILDSPKYLLNAAGHYDVVRNGQLLYYDHNHLTVQGARLLLPMFEALFQTR